MTSLRTMWGIDLPKVITEFGSETAALLQRSAALFVAQGHVEIHEGTYIRLTQSGKLLADHIASELFLLAE